jgi:nickel superoxide dismutase
MKKQRVICFFTTLALFALTASHAQAHCQVPCGIYDDAGRFSAMKEDAKTIGKATAEITTLVEKSDPLSVNQTVRWVQTKEEHASKIISVVSEYFLTQKIKVADSKDKGAWDTYTNRLHHAHALLRAAMKAKQTVSEESVTGLNAAIEAFEKSMH